MANLKYETRQKIIAQALREIAFARNYKQGKTRLWKINEDLYYGRKPASESSMANVDLGEMQSHVHTILSKVDEPLIFKFTKRKNAQLKRVTRLNAMRQYDQDRDDWDLKDIAGKKQAIIYGRAIYAYYADSQNGYTPHLENIDVYDFLVDPAAGGLFLEQARYLGDYGVVLSKEEIKEGIKSGLYLKTEGERLIENGANAETWNQEEVNKINRTRDQNVWQVNKEITGADKFKFWRWGTTYAGKRYYLLISERGGQAIEVVPIEEKFESGLWWYWTYAAFPDMTEFWTPSFCDYVRDLIMAKATSINQMLDNSEKINKPQRKVQSGSIENMAQLKYRREGNIIVKKDFDVNKAFQIVETPPLTAPLLVFAKLDEIQQRTGGVNAGDQGSAKNSSGSKVAIYEGNQANSADRFGYFNKSYAFGYKSFARLYEHGVKEHCIKRVAIDILGPNGVEIEEVSRRDIFRKNDTFGLMVEASSAELQLSSEEKDLKLKFLAAQDGAQSPVQNRKKSYEIQAKTVGFDEDTIRELMDTSEFGDEELMSEADRDIESILDGKNIPPNPAATTAYKQRITDYMYKNATSGLDMDDFMNLAKYIESLQPVIQRNMIRRANEVLAARAMADASNPETAAVIADAAKGLPPKQARPTPQPTPPADPTGVGGNNGGGAL